MMANRIPETQWSRLSELVADKIGLNFPPERRADLERGVAEAAGELGFGDVAACVEWLVAAPLTKAHLQALASRLTVGETYFFRDRETWSALADHVFPELIHAHRDGQQRLRLWSAACCTGEEPYSLAILLHQLLPDLPRWHVTITATDINARFLHKAAAGVYGEWSFRSEPPGFKDRYFKRGADGRYAILPEIRKLVSFEQLNLVEDFYPSLATDTNAMDLILCRNALMYFTSSQMRKVIGNLHHALVGGGWLAVSPSEASHTLFTQFERVNFPGVILYRKSDAKRQTAQRGTPARSTLRQAQGERETFGDAGDLVAPLIETPAPWRPQEPALVEIARAPVAVAESLYQEGRYSEAAETLRAALAQRPAEPAEFSLLARALANEGKLSEALAWCDRWIVAEKMNPAAHYLRSIILLEQGDQGEGRSSLRRAIYLEPDFVLAHFALGNLARGRGKMVEADKHYANALRVLRGLQPNDLLPESDGLTVGRLTETIRSLTGAETTS